MGLIETCPRGRWVRGYYSCEKCGEHKSKKLRLIPNNMRKNPIRKGCSVPWGKNKRVKRNPMKKKRRK